MSPQTGKILIAIGLVIAGAGILIYFFHDKLHWIGRLPGDIRIENKNVKFYFPITSMILISVVLTIILRLIRKC